jgi:hypothetical protein
MRTVATRTIAGTVSFNGTVLSGSGFTAVRSATGLYALGFPPGFRHVGTIGLVYRPRSDTAPLSERHHDDRLKLSASHDQDRFPSSLTGMANDDWRQPLPRPIGYGRMS